MMVETSRAIVFSGADRPLELCDIARPDPVGGEILVEVTACTLCGSDWHSLHGRRAVPVPTVLGHEILGRIVACGRDAPRIDAAGRELSVGSRVTWGIVASCGQCFYCRHDLPQKCERQTKYGHESFRPRKELTGGLAEHCLLAAGTTVLRVPDGLPDEVACPANCATATVAGAMELAGELRCRNVLLLGAGMLGVTAAAWARWAGASHVISCDVDKRRLTLAEQFGATRCATPDDLPSVIADCTQGYGADVAIELTGSTDAVENLFTSTTPIVRLGGTIVLIGAVFPDRPASLSIEQIVRRCWSLRGMHNYGPRHLRAALDFLDQQRAAPFASLVSPWRELTALLDPATATPPAQFLRLGVRPRRAMT